MTGLHHVRQGRGEPLLLIHPLGSELVVWEPVLELLAAERDVIAVDMPGFGASPPLPKGQAYSPQGLAAALAGFLDALGIERAHLAGNSLGGWVALELAGLGRALSVTGLSPAGFWSRPLGPRPSPGPQRRPGAASADRRAHPQRARPAPPARQLRGPS